MNTILNALHWGKPETIAAAFFAAIAIIGWFANEIDNAILVDENEITLDEHEEALF